MKAGCPPEPKAAVNLSRERERVSLSYVSGLRQQARLKAGNDAAFYNMSKTRRLLRDAMVTKGEYLRVHAKPGRYPACYGVDWKDRVLAVSPHFVIVDKPPGVPVCPSVDNWRENCLWLGAMAVGDEEPLHITHRLDIVTSGVVVMARTKEFQSYYNKLIVESRGNGTLSLKKIYLAICRKPPPLGRLTHYVQQSTVRKRQATYTKLVNETTPGGHFCEMEVLSVAEVKLGPQPTGEEWEGWPEIGYEVRIQLITGRTHQIRVQLAAVGSPILGDCLYAEKSPDTDLRVRAPVDRIGLQASELVLENQADSNTSRSKIWHKFFEEPLRTFKAGVPWWRQGA